MKKGLVFVAKKEENRLKAKGKGWGDK